MTPDEIDDRLARLPRPEIDDLSAERVRRLARQELARQKALGRLAPAAALWARVVTPALLVGACSAYLVWAVSAAGALYR
jgi:hypothetical protein